MKITKVKLENFAQHRSVISDISENIVGIVGRNGSGKSNFASAISMAVSGEFGKRKKKDLITFGQKKGSMQVDGLVRGKPFSVYRALHDNTCTLEYGGETIDGADPVNERLLELMGCDKSFLPNMVFVSQTDILGILFGRPAERNKMLQKFFGLEKAARLELLLGQWKSNITYPAIVDEAQSRAAIESLQEMIDENLEKIQGLSEEVEALSKSTGGVDVERVKQNYDSALRRERLEASLNDLNTSCIMNRETRSKLVAPPFKESDLESLQEQLNTNRLSLGAIENLNKLLDAAKNVDSSSECPICKSALGESAVADMCARRKESDATLAALSEAIRKGERELRQKRGELKEYDEEASSLDGSYKRDMAKIKEVENSLATETFPKFDSKTYMDGIRGIESVQQEIASCRSNISTLESTNKRLEGQIAQHNKDIETAKKVAAEFSGTKIHESRVSRIRDVFRHDGISGRYVNTQMSNMCASINQYLGSFGAAYKVSVGEDNEFICDFGDKKRPAADLSCGQKVVLSLAFRFAACETFSTGVDLIVLDEPTTWLDRETIGNFKNIIESISELSDSHNLQVLMVTHERSLMPYFRQTIEF